VRRSDENESDAFCLAAWLAGIRHQHHKHLCLGSSSSSIRLKEFVCVRRSGENESDVFCMVAWLAGVGRQHHKHLCLGSSIIRSKEFVCV
jgi:hypothetical protein